MKNQYNGVCRVKYGSASHTIINLSKLVLVNILSQLVGMDFRRRYNQFFLSGLCLKHSESYV